MLGRTALWLLTGCSLSCQAESRVIALPELGGVAAHWARVAEGVVVEVSSLHERDVTRIETADDEEIFLVALDPSGLPRHFALDLERQGQIELFDGDVAACPDGRVVGPFSREAHLPPLAFELWRLAADADAFAQVDRALAPSWLSSLVLRFPVTGHCGAGLDGPMEAEFGARGIDLIRAKYVEPDLVVATDLGPRLFVLRRGQDTPVSTATVGAAITDLAVARAVPGGPIVLTTHLDGTIQRRRLVSDALELIDVVRAGPALMRSVAISESGEVLAAGDAGIVGYAAAGDSAFAFSQLDGAPGLNRIAFGELQLPHVVALAGGAVAMGDVRTGEFEVTQPTTRTAVQILRVPFPNGRSEVWLVDTLGAVFRWSNGVWSSVTVTLPPEAIACSVRGEPNECGVPNLEQTMTTILPVSVDPPVLVAGFLGCNGLVSFNPEAPCTGWLGAPRAISPIENVRDSDRVDRLLLFSTSAGGLYEVQVP